MAIKEYNVDLDIKGKVLATVVPNSTGSIVTWNTTTNVFGLRTNAQIISDLNLSSNFITSNTAQTGLTGNKTSNGIWTLGQVRKAGQSDTQMLLAGGGHRPISDFALKAHTHTFASLTSKPTTIAGYGITDFNSLGDARYALRTRTISAGTGLTGGGNLTANRTIDLSTTTKSDIAKGVTAHGWGDFKDFGLGTNAIQKTGSYDDISENAFIYGPYLTDGPLGTGIAQMGLHIQADDVRKFQIISRTSGNNLYFRNSHTAGWTNWFELYHSGNFNPSQYATESWVNNQGFLKTAQAPLTNSTTNTISGTQVRRAALTGDVTAAANSNATTIVNNAVTTAKIANSAVTHAKYQNIATQRILGRGATGTGNVQELTLGANLSLSTAGVLSATNTTYSVFTRSVNGLVPRPTTTTTTRYLREDGTWVVPPNSNTTYSTGTLAQLNAGTDTTGRLQTAKLLNDWLNEKANATGTVSNSLVRRDGTKINTAGGFFETSDRRLKTYIKDMGDTLNKVLNVPTVSYNMNKQDSIGTIAQDVQEIFPELVNTDEDGMLSVNYAKLSIVAIKAIKELNERIQKLERI